MRPQPMRLELEIGVLTLRQLVIVKAIATPNVGSVGAYRSITSTARLGRAPPPEIRCTLLGALAHRPRAPRNCNIPNFTAQGKVIPRLLLIKNPASAKTKEFGPKELQPARHLGINVGGAASAKTHHISLGACRRHTRYGDHAPPFHRQTPNSRHSPLQHQSCLVCHGTRCSPAAHGVQNRRPSTPINYSTPLPARCSNNSPAV